MTERAEQNLYRAVWALIIVACLYFGGHVVAFAVTMDGTEGRPPASAVDEWPNCGPACHDPAAAADVQRIAAETGRTCWAEDNPAQPAGYEVLCR